MTTIYNKQGTAIVTIPTNGTKRRTLMGENSIKLEFEHIDYFDFALGCYVIYEYESDSLLIERFDIITPSIPEIYKDGFKYSLTFEAAECQLKRFNMFYDEGESSEVAFCLYDDIHTFGGLIAKCANKYIPTITWSYGGCNLKIEGVKNISFKGDKLYETLNMVAEAFDCEWWTQTNCGHDIVTGKLKTDVHIWFGKLSVGSEVDFEVNKTVSSMQRQGGDDANYGTRFFCFGSTKNLTPDYGQSSVKSGTAEIRLHLPDEMSYIDTKEGLTNEEIIHQTVFFDEIYPKNTDVVTKVEVEQRKVEGSETQKTFDAYIVTATDTPFVPSDIIKDQTLMIEFTSGQLWGQEFEVRIKYEPNTWKETDGFDKRFEIIAIQEQGDGEIFFLPNAAIKPVETDTFILKNVKLAKARIDEAEAELLSEGRKWVIKNSADTDVYNCPMNPVYCTLNDLSFDLGQKVQLVDKRFPNGRRISRIMGYEKRLENKYVGRYTVGDNTTYSHLGKMESDIKASQYTDRIGVDAGGTHIITKYDNTMPSDSNLFSALKTILTFAKLVGGNLFRGVQKFYDGLQSSDYVAGLTGRGFLIKKDESGKWRQDIDSLSIREFLEVPELRFNRVDVVSGELWNATAFGTIERVDRENKIATVKLLEGELLSSKVNDICRGIFYSLDGAVDAVDDNGFGQMKGFGTSYFTPTELLSDGKSFRYELQSGTTFHPCKAMKFVAYGNFSDKTRQDSAYSTRTYTRYLSGVNTWAINPDKHIVAQFGDIEGLTIGGVTMHGTGSFQKNMYMTGVHIQFTPEQEEELRGQDAYNVSLGSYEGVIKMASDGTIPTMFTQKNVITGDKNVVSGTDNVITNTFVLSTRIQAFKGASELFYAVTPSVGAYSVILSPINCDAVVSGGVLSVTSIGDITNAYVDLQVNCEGNAVFTKRYSVVGISDGQDGKDFEFIYTRTTSNNKPAPPNAKPIPPQNNQIDGYVPTGWTSDAVGVSLSYPYEWITKRNKVNGVWLDFSTVSLWSKYAFDGTPGRPGGDGYICVYKKSEEKPTTPIGTAKVPAGWQDYASTESNGLKSITHHDVWRKDVDGNYHAPITEKLTFTKNRIEIVTIEPTTINITLSIGGSSRNKGVIGYLNSVIGENSTSFAGQITTGRDQFTISIPTPGKHFIEIGHYKKKNIENVVDTFNYKVNSNPIPIGIWWSSSSVLVSSTGLSNGVWSDPVPYKGVDVNYVLESSITHITCNSLGTYTPSSFIVTLLGKYTDRTQLEISAYLAVYGYNGEKWVRIVNPTTKSSCVEVRTMNSYKQYMIKAHLSADPDFNSISIASYGVNVTEDVNNSSSKSMPRNCGEYKSDKPYVYDKNYQDCVYVVEKNVSLVYRVRVFGTELINKKPGVDDGWELGNKEIFTAIDTALIDGADIAGFLFKEKLMVSRDTTTTIVNGVSVELPNLSLNGKTGLFKALNADISGVINATSGSIGGFEIARGRIGVANSLDEYNNGLSLYNSSIKFKNEDYFVAIGTGVFPPSKATTAAGRFEINIEKWATNAIHNRALYIKASGCPETYADMGRNIAIEAIGGVKIKNTTGAESIALEVDGRIKLFGIRRAEDIGAANRYDRLAIAWDNNELVVYK